MRTVEKRSQNEQQPSTILFRSVPVVLTIRVICVGVVRNAIVQKVKNHYRSGGKKMYVEAFVDGVLALLVIEVVVFIGMMIVAAWRNIKND